MDKRSCRLAWVQKPYANSWLHAAVVLVGLAIAGSLAVEVHAAVPSSASFRVYNGGLNLFSGKATSTSFAVRDCLGPGPEAAGEASSASFKVQIGCVAALAGLPADDDDGDNVSSGLENAAPNNGDGNGDGIADSTQGNVASLPTSTGSGYLTLDVPSGGPCGQLLDVQAVDPSTLDGGDPDYVYPFGMVRFRIENCAGPVQVTLFLHDGFGGFVDTYRKYGFKAPDFVTPRSFYTFPGAVFGTTTVGSETVRTVAFSLSDNVLGDDSSVSMRIIDPSGPARLARPNTAPMLSPLGLTLVVLLLGSVGAFYLRQRTVQSAAERR